MHVFCLISISDRAHVSTNYFPAPGDTPALCFIYVNSGLFDLRESWILRVTLFRSQLTLEDVRRRGARAASEPRGQPPVPPQAGGGGCRVTRPRLSSDAAGPSPRLANPGEWSPGPQAGCYLLLGVGGAAQSFPQFLGFCTCCVLCGCLDSLESPFLKH